MPEQFTPLAVSKRQDALHRLFPQWEERTIAQHFYHQCQAYADRPLLIMPYREVSYAQTWQRAKVIAKSLLHRGVQKGDHVAVLMANDPDYIALWIATSLIGAIIIPLNTQLREEELEYMIRQSDTQWLILHQFAAKQNHAETIQRIQDNLAQKKTGKLQEVICIPRAQPIPDSFVSWDQFMASADNVSETTLEQHWKAAQFPHDTTAIIYTSGSTGLPKGVMLTDDMLLRSAFATCLTRGYEDGRRIFAPLPLYHVYFLQEGLFAVSFVGGTMISSVGFSPLQSIQLMEKYRANDFLAVPSMLVTILKQDELKTANLKSLYALLCCAAPSPVPLWQKAVDDLGLQEIGTGCGATEASSTTMLTEIGDALDVISSRVGKIKYAGIAGKEEYGDTSVRYKVIDPETGEDLPEGSVGELAVKGNVVSRGYYKKPEETDFARSPEGWMRSGDLGRIDTHGYIQLLGRNKNLYKVSGETVAPKEVEDVISKHPAVTQVYIVGVPDRFTTETGAAFVELKADKTTTSSAIRQCCKARVARFKVPRHVWFVKADDWPLTGTGKIKKFKLRDLAKRWLNSRN